MNLVGPTTAITSDLQKLLGENWRDPSGLAKSFHAFMKDVARRLSLQMDSKARKAPVPNTQSPLQSLFKCLVPRERSKLIARLVSALQTDGWLDSHGVLRHDSQDKDPVPERVDFSDHETGAAGGKVKRKKVDAADPAGGVTTHMLRMYPSEKRMLLVTLHTMLQLAAVAAHPHLQSLLAPRRVGTDTHAAGGAEDKHQARTNTKIENSSFPGLPWTALSNEECMSRIASRLHFGVATPDALYDFLRVVNCHLMPVQMAGHERSMQKHSMNSYPIIYSRHSRPTCQLPPDKAGLQHQNHTSRKLTLRKLMTGQDKTGGYCR